MKLSKRLVVLSCMLHGAVAQYSNASSTSAGTPTTTATNATSLTTNIAISVDDLWNLFVGPVSTFSVNTTVSPTPVPSTELIPPPPLYYSPSPAGAENPAVVHNASWSFPKDFWWGVASAAYQVEGAVKAEGRGPTIWDVLTHRATDYTVANQTGDIADWHYYLYKQDIARIAAMGVPAYSFSIAWSRVMPFGSGAVNEQALAHYDDMINTCLEYGIEPIVTLFHWDLPLFLQNSYGGWLSENIVNDFVTYADVVISRYQDRVSKWVTVNEPSVFCGDYPLPDGYFASTDIPPEQQKYFCGQNVLLAHSQAYHLAKSINSSLTVFFKNNGGDKIPLTNSSADALAVQRAWDFNEGWWANPIFINGQYGQYLESYVSQFLRPLTTEEQNSIVNTSDIYAIDAYTSSFYFAPDSGIDACTSNSSHPLYPSCANSSYTYSDADGGWLIGYAANPLSPWLYKATDWVVNYLQYIQDTWKPPQGIAVSEFGFAEPFEQDQTVLANIRTDLGRVQYYHDYMQAILLALSQGVNVVGCLAWAIFDNLEWAQGFESRFGMQYVNFTTQERAFKASFFEYVNAFQMYQEGASGSTGNYSVKI